MLSGMQKPKRPRDTNQMAKFLVDMMTGEGPKVDPVPDDGKDPAPRTGQNYHQWMSSQYGLKRLIEHIWMLIGMASVCQDMRDLRQRMAEKYGRQGVQFTMYLPPPTPGKYKEK